MLKENNFACDESNPKEVATSLRHFIDAYKEQKVTADTLAYDKVDLAYGLGELFANAVMNFYQWEYFYLDKGNDVAGFAVVILIKNGISLFIIISTIYFLMKKRKTTYC